MTNPDNKLKRYSLYNNIAKTEVGRRLHRAHHAEDAVLAVHQPARAPVGRDDLARPRCKKYGKDIALQPGGHRAVQVRRVEADRLPEGREVRRLLEEGLPEGRHHHLEAGGRQQHARRDDADRRGALHVPGALRAGRHAEGQGRPRGRRRAVDRPPLHVDEHAAKAVRQPEGAPGDQLRDQQGGAGQGRVQRLRVPGRGRRCRRASSTTSRLGPWPYDSAKAQGAADRSRLPERLRDRAVVGVQPQHRAEGDPVPAAAAGAGRHQGQDPGARSRASASRRSRAAQDPDDRAGPPVLRRLVVLHRRGRLGAASAAGVGIVRRRRLFNTAYYKNAKVDADDQGARSSPPTRPRRRSSTRTRRRRSGRTRPGPSWSPSGCCRSTTRSSPAST